MPKCEHGGSWSGGLRRVWGVVGCIMRRRPLKGKGRSSKDLALSSSSVSQRNIKSLSQRAWASDGTCSAVQGARQEPGTSSLKELV